MALDASIGANWRGAIGRGARWIKGKVSKGQSGRHRSHNSNKQRYYQHTLLKMQHHYENNWCREQS